MTPFTLKEHSLVISKPISTIWVASDVLGVKLQNIFQAQKQQSNDQRS
jgi:hypothetical protein